MSARVLAFRSVTPASRPQTTGALATAPRVFPRSIPSTPKVLTMSMRHRENTLPSTRPVPAIGASLSRMQDEMAAGYLEVPAEGITFKMLLAIYAEMFREARERTLGGVRSLFRLHPAH